MSIISTNLRQTRESARQIRFEPVTPITATSVQTAIQQVVALVIAQVPTPVNFAMSPYTVLPTDLILLVNTSAGAVTINMMPAVARSHAPIIIKDDTGDSGTNQISVVPNGSELIDGLSPYPINGSYSAVEFIPQAGGYFVGP